MSNGVHHVLPNREKGGWDLRRDGSSRPTGHYEYLSIALLYAREVSRKQGTELWIYNKRGEVVEVERPSESAR